jgi:hypothetical protein
MKLRWNKLGGQLGLLFCVAGLVLIWVGWNGAASYNDLRQQFPFLISGGISGLALVMIGVGLFVVQSQRADRVQLEANLVELRRILDRMTGASTGNGSEPAGSSAEVPGGPGVSPEVPGGPGVSPEVVVAGRTTYHRPSCRLLEGKEDLTTMTATTAEASGLAPCRTCAPGREPAPAT